MKLNKTVLGLLLIILIMVITGCSSSKERKIEELKSQVTILVGDSKYEEALVKYDEILAIDNSQIYIDEKDNIKVLLEEQKYEEQSVSVVLEFYEELYNIQKNRTRSGIEVTPTEMEYIIKDLRILTEKFENIDDSKDTEIARHVKSLKESLDYQLYKDTVDSKLHDDSGLSEAFGKLDAEMNMINTLAVASTRNILNERISNIIAKTIPSKYSE